MHSLGSWADGLITTSRRPSELRKIIAAFRKGGGEGKPIYLKVQLSYDTTFSKALAGAHQYLKNHRPHPGSWAALSGPNTPEPAFGLSEDEMRSLVRVSDNLDQHIQWLAQDIEAGVGNIYLHNVNSNQKQFIEVFGDKVLPQFHKSWLDE